MKRGSPARASISATEAARIFLRDQNGRAQPRLVPDPALDLPAVHGLRQRDAEIEIPLAAGIPAQRDQHADLDAVGIEMLASASGPGSNREGRPLPDRHRPAPHPATSGDGSRLRKRRGADGCHRPTDARSTAWRDKDGPRSTRSWPDGYRNRSRVAGIRPHCPARVRRCSYADLHGAIGFRQPRVSGKRIFRHDLAEQFAGQAHPAARDRRRTASADNPSRTETARRNRDGRSAVGSPRPRRRHRSAEP